MHGTPLWRLWRSSFRRKVLRAQLSSSRPKFLGQSRDSQADVTSPSCLGSGAAAQLCRSLWSISGATGRGPQYHFGQLTWPCSMSCAWVSLAVRLSLFPLVRPSGHVGDTEPGTATTRLQRRAVQTLFIPALLSHLNSVAKDIY